MIPSILWHRMPVARKTFCLLLTKDIAKKKATPIAIVIFAAATTKIEAVRIRDGTA